MKRVLLLLIFMVSALLPASSPMPLIYTGRYLHGLTIVENGAIVDGADISNDGSGVCLKITGDNVTVKNTKIHDCVDHGVLFLGTNGGTFENNEIYHAAMRYVPDSVSSGWPSLLKVQSVDETASGLAHDILIQNNYIHEGYGECMGLRGSRITVQDNQVKDCYSVGIYSNSDHTIVTRNFVYCTGNPEFNRNNLPMAGIGFAEEAFTNWGAHGHDTQTVTNNIVSGCKYGVRYGSSSNNQGLSNSVVAFNTLVTVNASISLTFYSTQVNLIVHNNLTNKAVNVTSTGASIQGNKLTTKTGSTPEAFKLTSPVLAVGSFRIDKDFGSNLRVEPLDAGAWEYFDTVSTPTPTPTATSIATLTPTATSTATPTSTPTQTFTPTPECHFFTNINRDVCIP
jgi:parallel beta-helix repeat protein